MENYKPIEKKFSLQGFLENKTKEEDLEDSKRSDYSEHDSKVSSSKTLELMLQKAPNRTGLIEKLFNPETKDEEFEDILKQINELNQNPHKTEGGYDLCCLTSSSGKDICFELYDQNGQFFAFENGKKPETLM